MKKTQEQVFLETKERLDYYRLPTVFPYEAIDLISQLLGLLDKDAKKTGKQNRQIDSSSVDSEFNDALRHQIGKVIQQNNKLHMELISAKEQILTIKHSNDKMLIQRSGGNKETTLLIQAQRKREDELFEELTQVKFKYNELMDLIHQDSEIQKKYIKRLMKHRHMEINPKEESSLHAKKKGPSETVSDLEAKLNLLQNKLANREAQIMRLHKRSEYDGLNMNKILKQFQNNKTDSKISGLEQQIEYLVEENKKMKKEVQDCRKKGGSKQAIREEMRKNHDTISKLTNDNKQLVRKLKERDFDFKSDTKLSQREVQKAQRAVQQKNEQCNKIIAQNKDLKKKIDFLESEVNAARQANEKYIKINENNQILIDKIKNSDEGQKILAQYEIQNLKRRAEELEVQLENQKERTNEFKSEIDYHKKEDKLKNDAIENLEKIVDELMRRNNQKDLGGDLTYQSNNLENTIALRKNLAQMKQQLATSQNDKIRLQRELETYILRFDQKAKQNLILNDDLNRLKIKLMELKNSEEQILTLQKQVSTIQSDLKKEQNFRFRIEQMHQESENDKTRLRKQLQQVTQEFEIYERKSKNHTNTLKMQNSELEESNQMLELISKQKQKKALLLQDQVEQLHGKIKIFKEELALLEDEKLNAIRQKHKYEKRCEDMLRASNEASNLTKQTLQLQSSELHRQVLDYQHEIKKLHDKVMVQIEQIDQLNSLIDALKLSQENVVQQKNRYKRDYESIRRIYEEKLKNEESSRAENAGN